MSMPMLAGVGLLVVCCSSASAAAMMMGGDDDDKKKTPLGPSAPVDPTPVLRDTPETMRSASTVYGDIAIGASPCGMGRLDSTGGWCAKNLEIGEWYQMDNGVVGKITGVAIMGRGSNEQWVKTFKVQSKGATGTWTEVDSGKVYTGNTDKETQVDVTFDAPVDARYIRIYPQTWNNHMSMRTDIVAGKTRTDKTPTIVDVPYSGHKSTANWGDDAIGTSHGAGRLDSTRAWSSQVNAIGKWYQLSLNSPVNVSGVAMKGRPDHPQWVTSTKFQYENEDGGFVGVDGGFSFDTSYGRHSIMKIIFRKPVRSKAIRICPHTWNGNMSRRYGILRGVSATEAYKSRPVEKEIEAFSFY